MADRQLKSARQFLEEHASERDQEVEELVAARDKLSMQLREQEAQIALQGTKDKEVREDASIIYLSTHAYTYLCCVLMYVYFFFKVIWIKFWELIFT